MEIVRQAVPLTAADAAEFGLFALTLNANRDHEQALLMAQKAVGLDPGSFWAEFSYGLVLEDSNRLDEALKALDTPTTSAYIPMMKAFRQYFAIHRRSLCPEGRYGQGSRALSRRCQQHRPQLHAR